MRTRHPAALVALLVLPGCMTLMETGRARTLERGESELGTNVALTHFDVTERVPTATPKGGLVPFPVPPVVIWYGRGITDRVELDVRAALVEASAGVKVGVLRQPRVNLSVSPSVGWAAWGRPDQEQAGRANLAVLAGVALGERLEVDAAAQASWSLHPESGTPDLLGGTFGIHWGPFAGGLRRAGIAVTWLRYDAVSPAPGDASKAEYLGAALVLSLAANNRPSSSSR